MKTIPAILLTLAVAVPATWFATQKLYDNEPLKARIAKESGLRTGELSLEAAKTIAVPTLLVWGESDELIPVRVGLEAVEVIPNAQLRIFRDVGHIPSVECPAEFVQAVAQALAAGRAVAPTN